MEVLHVKLVSPLIMQLLISTPRKGFDFVELALQAWIEQATYGLTVRRSTSELLENIWCSREYLKLDKGLIRTPFYH